LVVIGRRKFLDIWFGSDLGISVWLALLLMVIGERAGGCFCVVIFCCGGVGLGVVVEFLRIVFDAETGREEEEELLLTFALA
jgi:hypothetical protein